MKKPIYWHKYQIWALNAHLVALIVGNEGENGPHQDPTHLKSSPHHMESLSTRNMVPHHHQECINWGSLARLEGSLPCKIEVKGHKICQYNLPVIVNHLMYH